MASHDKSAEYSAIEVEETEQRKSSMESLDLPMENPQLLDRPVHLNLISGTARLAQGGVFGLGMIILGATAHAGMGFFSWHILSNTTALIFATQSILLLQPTHTPIRKRQGISWHFGLNVGSLSGFLAGLIIIEMNKHAHDGEHFKSFHAYLGAFTYVLLLLQGAVGFTQYYTPLLYGSVERARSIWKYHRACGYLTLISACLTVAAAMHTEYNQVMLHIPAWIIYVALALVLAGVLTRVRLLKLGISVA
ncbi:eukaryotic cytochrome b561-domain-containing protein [Xylariaceae sp. FL0016]|nr:eukaryotic cytochrome b561-domain-containing protein [Xylariaceae sp. FL0016]